MTEHKEKNTQVTSATVESVKREIMGFSQFCKMSPGKWNIIATSLN